DLVVKTADIATTLERLDALSVDRLLGLAAAREAVDVAPGEDPDQDDDALDRKLADWRARWSGLRSWFLGDHAHPSQASLLRLRATGQYQRRGMVAAVIDRGDAKRLLARRLDAERLQTEEARRRLVTRHATRLSSLVSLDRDEFGLFLGLLGDALAAGPPGAD